MHAESKPSSRPIVWCDWPQRRLPVWFLVVFAVFSASIGLVQLVRVPDAAVLGGALILTALVSAVVAVRNEMWSRRIRRDLAVFDEAPERYPPAEAARAILRRLGSPDVRTMSFYQPPRFDRLAAAYADRDLPRPVTVAAEALRPKTGTIEITSAFLEPESISAGRTRSLGPALLWVVAAVLAGLVFARYGAFASIFAVLILLPILMPMVGTWLERRDVSLGGGGEVVAGLGVVADGRGRRWTRDDAILLVHPGSGFVQVDLVGTAGRLEWRFYTPDAPGLVRLWQRWNHPEPRPDLLE